MTFLVNILDILIVAYIFYKLILLIKGTRAVQVLFGIIILFLLTIFTNKLLHLATLNWLLEHFWLTAALIIAIVFQPELRSALAQLGTEPIGIFSAYKFEFIDEIIPALKEFQQKRIGALIILEHETGLKNYIETGTIINGKVTKELLLSIFYPKSILHDGAVILRESAIIAAGCILPLSDNLNIARELGTRHRAGIGISEISDAIAIIVSEESGGISLIYKTKIEQDINVDDLKKRLIQIYRTRFEKGLVRKTKTIQNNDIINNG